MPQNEPDIADDATVDYGDQDDRDTVNYGSDIDVDDVVLNLCICICKVCV